MSNIIPTKISGSMYDSMDKIVHASEDGWELVTSTRDDRDPWRRVYLIYRGYIMAQKMSTIKQLIAKLKNGKGAEAILSNWIKDNLKTNRAKIKNQRAIANDILDECNTLEQLIKGD